MDDPPDTAGIEPDQTRTPRWWVDIEGGQKSIISDLGLDADPAAVAAWIATTAHQEHSPVAADAGLQRRNAIVAAAHPATLGDSPRATTVTPDQNGAARPRNTGRDR